MRFPKMLKPGDTVGLICTSSCVSAQRVEECVNTVKALGYQVKLADNLGIMYGG